MCRLSAFINCITIFKSVHNYGCIVFLCRQMWDKMAVQRLFIENVCPANAGVEEKIAQQGIMLWKVISVIVGGKYKLLGTWLVDLQNTPVGF